MTTLVHRLIATGGRGFIDYQRIEDDFRALIPLGLHRVAEGNSPGGGADDHAYDAWHLLRNECTRRYPASYPQDGTGSAKYLRRNTRMVETEIAAAKAASERIIGSAYPEHDSRGTWHCTAEMLRRGVPVAVWLPWANPLRHRLKGLHFAIAEGLAKYNLRDPLVYDRGGHRAIVAPVGQSKEEFVDLALPLLEVLGD